MFSSFNYQPALIASFIVTLVSAACNSIPVQQPVQFTRTTDAPTLTPASSPMPTITPTSLPDLSNVVLRVSDYPPNFVEIPQDELDERAFEDLFGAYMHPFGHWNSDTSEEVRGYVYFLADSNTRNTFDRIIQQPELLSSTDEWNNEAVQVGIDSMQKIDDLGDAGMWATVLTRTDVQVLCCGELIIFRRGQIGIILSYGAPGPDYTVHLIQLAHLLDQRAAQAQQQ